MDDLRDMVLDLLGNRKDKKIWAKSAEEKGIDVVVSVSHFDEGELEKKLCAFCPCRLWKIKTEDLSGVFIEYSDFHILAFYPTRFTKVNGLHDYDQGVNVELSENIQRYAMLNDVEKLKILHFSDFVAILACYDNALSIIHGLSLQEVLRQKALNTHNQIVNNLLYINGAETIDGIERLHYFTLIYHIEFCIIGMLFNKKGALSIHDVATNTGHFPSLAATKEGAGISFYRQIDSIFCSDINPEYASQTFSLLKESLSYGRQFDDIKLMRLDIKSEDLLPVDVITANDVLEHFDEPESFSVFTRLWNQTNDVLMIHVPIELTPNPMFEHKVIFTRETLEKWVSTLDQCENITHIARGFGILGVDSNLLDGFLILRKTVQIV